MSKPMKVNFLTKNDTYGFAAANVAKQYFNDVRVTYSSDGLLDEEEMRRHFLGVDVVLSYCWPFRAPKAILDHVNLALNFHPGPSNYPGIGCYNFALYDGIETYGAVCHLMEEKFDTGKIVKEVSFLVAKNETVASLKRRTHCAMLFMFDGVCSRLADEDNSFLGNGKLWGREPYTRKDLEDLKTITADMGVEEIRRRIRASYFPGTSGAHIDIGGYRFVCFDPTTLDRKDE